jgi:methionyl-tRNA formyltransferase
MQLVFLGTPAFAVPTLERILQAGHRVLCVVTQPDRPKGRGREMAASPVKQAAERHQLPVFQPERIRRPEAVSHLFAIPVDAMVVVGYGQIIPQSIIDLAPHGIINVHASLLPSYRGAAPVQWAMINGESHTGVTTMRIDAGLDTGETLLKAETAIDPEETAVELGERLAILGADLLVTTLEHLERGTLTPHPQDASQATYAPILEKAHGRIDWHLPAQSVHNRVRGLQPWPGAYTRFRGQTVHIWRTRVAPAEVGLAPGRLLQKRDLLVGCAPGSALALLEVQLEGRKRISAKEFANGQRLTENDLLGDLSN